MATIALLGGEIDLIGSENPSVSVGSDNIEERGILDYQNDVYLGSPLREYSIAGDVDDVDDDDRSWLMYRVNSTNITTTTTILRLRHQQHNKKKKRRAREIEAKRR